MYFIGLDLGTSGLKAGVIDDTGNIKADLYMDTHFIASHPGKVKQSIDEFFTGSVQSIAAVVRKAGIDPLEVGGIVCDGQMGGVIGIDKDFHSITDLDMNLDMSSEKYNEYMHRKYGDLLARFTCGSSLNGQKIIWWKEERPEFYNHICKFVTLNGYVAGKLAGLAGEEAFIDYTLLAFSGIDDARKLEWSKDLCDCLNIDMKKLPAIVPPEKTVGGLGRDAALQCGLLEGTPVFAGAGDQAAGFLGAGLIQAGSLIDVSGSSTLLSLCVDRFIPDVGNRAVMYMPSVKSGIYHAFTYINGGGMSLTWFIDELCGENDKDLQSKYKEITDGILIILIFMKIYF